MAGHDNATQGFHQQESNRMIRLWIPGIPAPGGSKKVFVNRHTGRVAVMDAGKNNKPWRSLVATIGADNISTPIAGPLAVTFHFVMPRPRSHYGTGRNAGTLKRSAPDWHISPPDATKLVRAAEDALTGIAWNDDRQIVHQTATKRYGESPGLEIVVGPATQKE
jgi:Holliday junction resolvase RusA-like endonuclease